MARNLQMYHQNGGNMLKKITFILTINLMLAGAIWGQTVMQIEEILRQTQLQTAIYQETFRNLIALETKTFEEYNNQGELKKQNKVEANLLVYQSSKNPKLAFELRNVLKVNDKLIPNSQQNSEQFFAELNKTSTLKSELEKIQKTSSKYDKTFETSGLTLYEGIILSSNLQPYFEYKLVGTEMIQDRNVYLISYQQTRSSPFISIDGKGVDTNNPSLEFSLDLPKNLKKHDIFVRGKLWIDAQTFQIWREDRELVVQAPEPLILLESSFAYQSSKYAILVPKQINLLVNEIKKKAGKFLAVKDTKVIFDYSEFKRTESDVKILDDTEQ